MSDGELFPATITQYRCPDCGKPVKGSYNLDEGRARCTKTWHTSAPVAQRYARIDAASPQPQSTDLQHGEEADRGD